MSSSQELYNHLNKKLRELVHVKNGKQMTNWIWIIVGMLQSRSSIFRPLTYDARIHPQPT